MFLVLDFDHMNFECKYCCRLAAVHTFVEGLTLMNWERQNRLAVVEYRFVEGLTLMNWERQNPLAVVVDRLDRLVEELTLMNWERINPLAVAVDKFVEELIELVEGPAELVACFFIAGFWRSIRKFCPSFIKDLL